MKNETLQEKQLARADILAMKKADSICFRYNLSQKLSVIDCIKKADEKNPFEQCHRIEVEGGIRSPDKYSSAFYHIGSSQYDQTFQTIASLLKAGDELFIEFCPGHNTNEYLRVASGETVAGTYFTGLHGDVLMLRVTRGRKRMVFYIGMSVCPDNSARMVNI